MGSAGGSPARGETGAHVGRHGPRRGPYRTRRDRRTVGDALDLTVGGVRASGPAVSMRHGRPPHHGIGTTAHAPPAPPPSPETRRAAHAGTAPPRRTRDTDRAKRVAPRRHHEGMSPSPRKRRKCATGRRCTTCDGYGAAKHGHGRTCRVCDGTGKAPAAPTAIQRPSPGRPSKVSTHGPAILERMRLGMDPETAATKSGVHPDTVERWCARGYDAQTLIDEGYELPDGDVRLAYHRFLLEFLDARDDLYEILVRGIRDDAVAGKLDTRESLAVLERLRSDKWGRRDHLTIAGAEPGAGVPMTERYADTLADLLRGIIADLGLTAEQAQHVPVVIERNLERVSARERMRA